MARQGYRGLSMRPDCCHTLVGALLFLVAVIGFSAPASGQHMGNFSYGSGLHEEESRFLPGLYYFHKGCDYNERGQIGPAIQAWKLSAGWAMSRTRAALLKRPQNARIPDSRMHSLLRGPIRRRTNTTARTRCGAP